MVCKAHISSNGNVLSRGYTLSVRETFGLRKFPVRFHPDERAQAKLRVNRAKLLGTDEENLGVLVIYSGGTIGSGPNDDEDPHSPRVAKSWPEVIRRLPAFHDEGQYGLNFPLDVVAFEEPLDSSNIGPTEWSAIALLLNEYMGSYEGFVVVHGTDTMVYTAAALSFMLEHLKKPVILTGSQLSVIDNVRNDAQQNLITALLFANARYSGIPNVPEVCIVFGDQLLRGNRAVKMDASNYTAYETPNYGVLGTAGGKITIHEELIRKSDHQAFNVKERLDTNVMDVVVFPGIQNTVLLSRIFDIPGLRAVVLRTFGAGNTPTPPAFLAQLEVASKKGIIVVNVTQCARGNVDMGLYETSAALMRYGVVSGGDCTPVAALTKLMVLLGDDRLTQEEVARRAAEDLCGEQSTSIFVTSLQLDAAATTNSIMRVNRGLRTSRMLTERYVPDLDGRFLHASLVLYSATVLPGTGDRVVLNVYINVARDEELRSEHEKLACCVSPLAVEDGTLVFDVSTALQKYSDGMRRNAFTLEIASPDGEVSWSRAELALHTATA